MLSSLWLWVASLLQNCDGKGRVVNDWFLITFVINSSDMVYTFATTAQLWSAYTTAIRLLPGPACRRWTLNVTQLLGKADILQALDGHLLACSETSHTLRAGRAIQQEFRHHLNVSLGAPVPDKFVVASGCSSYSGLSHGVGIVSSCELLLLCPMSITMFTGNPSGYTSPQVNLDCFQLTVLAHQNHLLMTGYCE